MARAWPILRPFIRLKTKGLYRIFSVGLGESRYFFPDAGKKCPVENSSGTSTLWWFVGRTGAWKPTARKSAAGERYAE
jgi:hypothetical protein